MEPTNQQYGQSQQSYDQQPYDQQPYGQQSQQPYGQPQQQVQYVYQSGSQIPPEYQPISMWGYFGYQLLFAIPCVGFIMAIVYALTATNVNLKNFARSYFCVMIIATILSFIIFTILGASVAAIMESLY